MFPTYPLSVGFTVSTMLFIIIVICYSESVRPRTQLIVTGAFQKDFIPQDIKDKGIIIIVLS